MLKENQKRKHVESVEYIVRSLRAIWNCLDRIFFFAVIHNFTYFTFDTWAGCDVVIYISFFVRFSVRFCFVFKYTLILRRYLIWFLIFSKSILALFPSRKWRKIQKYEFNTHTHTRTQFRQMGMVNRNRPKITMQPNQANGIFIHHLLKYFYFNHWNVAHVHISI